MAETLIDSWRTAVPVLLAALAILSYLRVRTSRELAEAAERDEGRYWQTLSWEERIRYRRRILVVSWAFIVLLISTLAYGVWLHWYDLKFGPF